VLDTTTWREQQERRREAIDKLLEEFAPSPDHRLLSEMIETVCRCARDRTGRGELKILNKALKELRHAFRTFTGWEDIRKVTIFGSSRTKEDAPTYREAVRFGELMRENHWMVITGAGDGIMKAGHEGAGRAASFGVGILLPFEQKPNEVIAEDHKLMNFKYFFTRKLMFVKEASAMALFPGGFGTQDETFECLTLVQTGKSNLMPIVMVDRPGGTYWKRWREFVVAELLGNGNVDEEDLNLVQITDDADQAVKWILDFYRRYHSSRYVRDKLVIRLHPPLTDKELVRLNDEFGDILTKGRIEQVPLPLPEENNERASYARLILHFNKRAHGRLRQLVDTLNASLPTT
jgi:uncharacterized protein (TIGR00730 family)